MFVTDDSDLYEHVLTLSNHGRARGQIKQFWPDMVGFKYKMSNVQAAIGCAQIERIGELIQRKKQILHSYRDQLKNFASIALNPEPSGTINGAWMPTVVFDAVTGITREILKEAFTRENIDARVCFWPLSSLPCFHQSANTSVSESFSLRAINLPSYHDISDEEISRVCSVIRSLVA